MAERGSQGAAARYGRQATKRRGKRRRGPRPPQGQPEPVASTAESRPSPASLPRPQPSPLAPRPRVATTTRQATPDYRYVMSDLMRIGALAIVMLAIMGALALVLR